MCVKYSAPLTWGKSGLRWQRPERRMPVVAAGQVIKLERLPSSDLAVAPDRSATPEDCAAMERVTV